MKDEQKALIPETHQDLPASTALATAGPRGEAQSSPVWFGRDGPERTTRKGG
jgi:hypothetical protein